MNQSAAILYDVPEDNGTLASLVSATAQWDSVYFTNAGNSYHGFGSDWLEFVKLIAGSATESALLDTPLSTISPTRVPCSVPSLVSMLLPTPSLSQHLPEHSSRTLLTEGLHSTVLTSNASSRRQWSTTAWVQSITNR